MSAFPELAIVIVNWNLKDSTIACVQSLLKAGAELEQILIVDNGSTDHSVVELTNLFGAQLKQIETGANLGFAGGVNVGVSYLLGESFEWLMLINNDTQVASDFLVEYQKASALGGYEILGCTVYYEDRPNIIWYVGENLIPGTLFTRNKYRGYPFPATPESVLPFDFVCGCGMMVHRQVWGRIGGFDSSLFMYGEEVDFIWRARNAGYTVGVATRAKMWHGIEGSAISNFKPRYLQVRNQIIFYRRYASVMQLGATFVYSFLRVLLLAGSALIKRDNQLVKYTIKGFLDGWFQKLPLPNIQLEFI